MNRRIILCVLIWALPLIAAGCSSPQSFSITITNLTNDTIQVYLTKVKPPYEQNYEPPEQQLKLRDELNGLAIPPDLSAHIVTKLDLAHDNIAVLQVYRSSDPKRVLGISPGNPDRVDYPIDPGYINIAFKVNDKGTLICVPFNATLKAPPTTLPAK